MIVGKHTLVYTSDATATRQFFKEVLQLPFVSDEGGDDPAEWLIFRTGPSEIGVHPSDGPEGEHWADPGHHQITFICDSIADTIADLRGRGAQFEGEPQDMGFGVGVDLHVPGAGTMLLYEPKHTIAYDT